MPDEGQPRQYQMKHLPVQQCRLQPIIEIELQRRQHRLLEQWQCGRIAGAHYDGVDIAARPVGEYHTMHVEPQRRGAIHANGFLAH
jgi:hypothetical protein